MKNIKKILITLVLIIGSIIVISKISIENNRFNYIDTYETKETGANEFRYSNTNESEDKEITVNALIELEELQGDLESASFKLVSHTITVLSLVIIFCLIVIIITSDLVYAILGIFKKNDK